MNRIRRLYKNQLGQMSVFLALTFQVLFVFFAMIVNIGLLVHDKINLQNSVDLGAFYGAQRQAEILNEIAHLNYQIRQDYKLLAWRVWVVGTLGRDFRNNPQFIPPARGLQQLADGSRPPPPQDAPRYYPVPAAQGANTFVQVEEAPVACLAYPMWYEFAALAGGQISNENYCWKHYGFVSTPIAVPPGGGGPIFAALNAAIAAFSNASASASVKSCEEASPLSWAFTAQILASYKYSIAQKKLKIRSLRAMLVSNDMMDFQGNTVRAGIEKTVLKNMTEANRESSPRIEVLNGLTKGGCDGNQGEVLLPEILTAPGIYFALLRQEGARSCSFTNAFQSEFNRITPPTLLDIWDQGSVLRNVVASEPLPTDPTHSSLGYEKNPWCMAYVGVKATTKPRKPFAPFGDPVTLEARSFAQPFGGRIGPWYGNRWARGAAMSAAPAMPEPPPIQPGQGPALQPAPGQEARLDRLTSPRVMPGSGSYTYNYFSIPNYSRYPGDNLGMRSQLAQAMGRHFFSSLDITQVKPPLADQRMKAIWFTMFGDMDKHGDALAWDRRTNGSGPGQDFVDRYRSVEMAAVAPDLFDITYYSIEPENAASYYQLELQQQITRYPAMASAGGSRVAMGDLGSRYEPEVRRKSSVEQQILAANNPDPLKAGTDISLRPNNYWMVRDWTHVLTGWVSNSVSDFTFPLERFGQCFPNGTAFETAPIPGKCAAGGRVGYSVRGVSRHHLNGEWKVGGEGEAPSQLMNPPGEW